MGNLKTRINRVERELNTSHEQLMGVLDIPRSIRPLDVLQKAAPGLWLMICDVTSEGLMGRVSARGKCEILYGGGVE